MALCVCCVFGFCFYCLFCFSVVCLVALSDSIWLFMYVVCLAFVWSAWLPHQTVYGSLCMLCVWLLCGLLGYPIRQYMALCMSCVFGFCLVCLVTPSDSIWLFMYVVCLSFVWSALLSHQSVYCSLCMLCVWLLCGLLGYLIRQYMALYVCCVFGFCVVCLVTPSDSIWLFMYVVCLAFVWSAWLPHQTVYGSLYVLCIWLLFGLLGYPIRQYMALYVCCLFVFCVVCFVISSVSILLFMYVVCLAFVWSAWLPHQTVYGSLCMLCVWLLCGLLGYPIRQYMALYVCCVFGFCVVCLVTPSDSIWLFVCLVYLAFVWSAWLPHQTVYGSLCMLFVCLLCGLLCYLISQYIALYVCCVFGFCVVCLVTSSDSIWLFMYVVCLAFVWSAWLPHQTVYGSLCVLCVWLSFLLCVWLLCGLLGYSIRHYMALYVCCVFGFFVYCVVWLYVVILVFLCVIIWIFMCFVWLSYVWSDWLPYEIVYCFLFMLCVWLLCGLLGYPIRQYMALCVCCVFGSLFYCVFGFCVVSLVTPSDSIWLFMYVVCLAFLCIAWFGYMWLFWFFCVSLYGFLCVLCGCLMCGLIGCPMR